MSKIVIAGSASLQKNIAKWQNFFAQRNHNLLDFPKSISSTSFMQDYPAIHKAFFKAITQTEILFIMNEDKNNIEGYIGAEIFAELAFGVAQKLINDQKIEIILLKKPSPLVQSNEEVNLWLKLGWISLFQDSCIK